MTDTTASNADDPMADQGTLKQRLAKAERRNKLRAYGLVLPLFIFSAIFFFFPIGLMMFNSIDNPLVANAVPKTVEALKTQWDSRKDTLPPEEVYATFGKEFHDLDRLTQSRMARRMNFENAGLLTLVRRTGSRLNALGKETEGGLDAITDWKTTLIEVDGRWGDAEVWATMRNIGDPITGNYYLNALDLRRDKHGEITTVDENRSIYIDVAVRTFWISGLVTFFCILLGYPVSFLLANLPMRYSNLLMILVLLPFWTSLLVRTTAWIVVLQDQGVLNDVLIFLHLIPDRVQLIYNRFGVIVSMTHILLPFMILPIYSVMKNINPSHVRAARSLGATQWTAFWRVYFPQSVPGIGAGGLLVFILALGYYITPALVGGPTDQMTSYFIADHTERSLNWGLASALGGILLASVLAIYLLYNRFVGIDNMKLG